MSRAVGRAVAAALLGALAGAAWLVLFYARDPALRLDFDVTPPRAVLAGVYPAELDASTSHSFAWTGEVLTLRLPDLDRKVDWTMDMRVRGARSDRQNPSLSFYVDGLLVLAQGSATDYEHVRVPVAARATQAGATIAMNVSTTFVPGPSDPRALGVMIDSIAVEPAGIVLPPRAAFSGAVLASAVMGAAVALLEVTAGSAVGAVVIISAGLAALASRGLAPFTNYPADMARCAIWIGIATLTAAWIARLIRRQPFRNTAKFAIVFSASTLLLQMLILLHPNMPIGDALFHAHRFQDVLGGRLYFTSTAPGNYLFPYAPGLYVLAYPLAGMVRRGASDMTLLRTIVCSANAAAGLLLYPMVVGARGDRLAGAIAVALYQLIPLGFGVIAVGNLTNAFAQSVCVAVLGVIAAPSLRLEHRSVVGLLAATLAAAFLSHTSAFAIGLVAACLIAGVFRWWGGPAMRSPAAAVLVATIVATTLAVVVYYAHFMETYRTELARIGAETATAAPDAGGRSIGARIMSVPRYVYMYFGIPALALSAWGAVALWQRGARDRLTLAVCGWAAACVGFLLLGVLTPVDMRYYLAAIPVVAVTGALGAGTAWATGRTPRAVAAVLLAWSVLNMIRSGWSTLG
jgi:hypothetical protein